MVSEEVKVTYTQDWTAYNAAQCEEKDRFMPMLADLCSTIPTRHRARDGPVCPCRDMAFSASPASTRACPPAVLDSRRA